MGTAENLQALMERRLDQAPGVLLSVNAPRQGLHWQGSAGTCNRETGAELNTGHSFRIASMSKTFTGLLCAQLVEAGRLDLSTPAIELLPEDVAARIPVASGHQPREISVEQLLQHRAGFNDFATSEAWFLDIAGDPGRFRDPGEIAAWALSHGDLVGAPDEIYHYSDTGYVLLGLILENITGQSYAESCRRHIFDPLGMEHTYLEGHEDSRGELSHCYVFMEGEYIDALQINGSCDWAGGGHVSTLADIDTFLRAAFTGALFERPETLQQFVGGRLAKEGFYYGMGVGRKQLVGKNLWGHLGHWGSFMYWCPEEQLSLCGTLNYDGAQHNDFLEQILRELF